MAYKVEAYTIDTARREIARGEVTVAVEPKVFDLLLYLIENRDRVIGKRELVDQLWGGRIISEDALYSCIKAARRAIGDDGRQQRLIRTSQRVGFRFVGPVEVEPDGQASAMSLILPGAGAEDAAAADGATFDLDLNLPRRPSVAVLPFRALSAEPEHALLADGLGNDITVRLARTRWLFVTARASAARFQAPELDAVEIGQRLGVRYLLRGTLMADDRRMRLVVSLCDTVEGRDIWAERFDRKIDDLFALQDEIGDLIVAGVEGEIEQKERRRALLQPFASLDAWSAYHRACHHLYRYLPETHEEAERYLRLAAKLDPNAARVFAALSFMHWQRAFLETVPDREAEVALALDNARHAVSLDGLDPQAHWALGRACLLEGAFEQGVEELRSAIDLNPNFANGHYSLAFGLMFAGQSEHGFDCVAKARRLSPYDPMTFAFLAQRGQMHGLTGDFEAAADWSARAVRQPNAHYHLLAMAAWWHELAGRRDGARGYLARLLAVRPGYQGEDYFRAFPFRPAQRTLLQKAMTSLGL